MRGISRKQIAQTVNVPAPTGGLNAVDALAAMPPQDAAVMDNFFPTPSNVALRNGYKSWVTGFTQPVYSLMTYNSGTGRKMFAASNGNIYDVTVTGVIGSPVVTGNTSDKWQHINFATSGGQYLLAVNGSDSPQLYNGTTWQAVTAASSPIAITGVTTSNLIHVNMFKGRVFFIEKNSTRAWFLPLNNLGGVATVLDFGSYLTLGGYINCLVTWTIDNSGGTDTLAAFISSEGEVLLYRGSDPTYASSWFLQGVFRIGRPVGYRCYVRIGSDVGVISADGLFPMSEALLTDRSQRKDAISNKITNLINTDVQSFAGAFGWQPILYPIGNKLIVNVPGGGLPYQYVMNTVNGSWCRFVGWNANVFELMGDSLFFGGAQVYQCDTGLTDNGANINAVAIQAPQYFGTTQQKQFTMARTILSSNSAIRPAFQINTDFDLSTPVQTTSFSTVKFTPWGSPWYSPWSSPSLIRRDWQNVNSIGFVGSPALSLSAKNAVINWQSSDVCFINGDPL